MKKKQKLKIAGGVVLAAAAVALVVLTATRLEQYLAARNAPAPVQDTERVRAALEEDTLVVDGVRYRHKEGVESYLLMGVDRTAEQVEAGALGGQADVLLLLVLDRREDTYRVLEINRDTMTMVSTLDEEGDVSAETFQPICLSHAWGSGLEDSCETTVRALRYLLADEPVEGYIAINMDAIGILNDAVGGVSVRIEKDLTGANPEFVENAEVLLDAEMAEQYIRARMNVGEDDNYSRMERQKQYMEAWFSKTRQKAESDSSFMLGLLEELGSGAVTDMTEKRLTAVLNDIYKYERGDAVTIDGTYEMGEAFNEFYPDDESLQSVILTLFYETDE